MSSFRARRYGNVLRSSGVNQCSAAINLIRVSGRGAINPPHYHAARLPLRRAKTFSKQRKKKLSIHIQPTTPLSRAGNGSDRFVGSTFRSIKQSRARRPPGRAANQREPALCRVNLTNAPRPPRGLPPCPCTLVNAIRPILITMSFLGTCTAVTAERV
ncbi:hypothetical protein EVAR_33921_1 [Eumeta japonica]|uniref:Uncharacterized protein n=1 Tax=Eumeta variegata TaxID=151549 RepID=A0A4C1VX71_EUMVA|nr:hypothetical protein EVAR_33921_1 [Eumeta japonica]